MKKFLLKWYPVIIAFACMMYSISLGLAGMTDEAQYSAHWPGTILLFSLLLTKLTGYELSIFRSRFFIVFSLFNISYLEYNIQR